MEWRLAAQTAWVRARRALLMPTTEMTMRIPVRKRVTSISVVVSARRGREGGGEACTENVRTEQFMCTREESAARNERSRESILSTMISLTSNKSVRGSQWMSGRHEEPSIPIVAHEFLNCQRKVERFGERGGRRVFTGASGRVPCPSVQCHDMRDSGAVSGGGRNWSGCMSALFHAGREPGGRMSRL